MKKDDTATKDLIKESYLRHLRLTLAKRPDRATSMDRYKALALAIRDLMVDRWIQTRLDYTERNPRWVNYLSLEYLIGRTLGNAMINLGVFDDAREAMSELGEDVAELRDEEVDAGLGNGGLGRLAACFLDSMATLDLPATGYGIRYNFGIFKQRINSAGEQVEEPDNWLRNGNTWEIQRPEHIRMVKFYGRSVPARTSEDSYRREWVDTKDVIAMPYDTPIPGYGTDTVNTLRLWSANSAYGFDLEDFNKGDFINANLDSLLTENITKVLYPNDNNYEGKELRLKQQYFLVSASLQDIIATYLERGNDIRKLSDKVVLQLNDTHPALAVPELMRLLVDEHGLEWDEAWRICRESCNYTNHTLMPEALEKWPVDMLGSLLPRIKEIIYLINDQFLSEVSKRYPGDNQKLARMSLIEEGSVKMVRMAYMAVVASHRVNGVAALHTELLKNGMFREFNEFYPGKFENVTNGITPRRWLRKANPGLSELVSERIGDAWIRNLDLLEGVAEFAEDSGFQERFMEIKRANKEKLAALIQDRNGVVVDSSAIFDVQVKRLHEYKRQLLNILHAVSLYLDLKDNPKMDFTPRVIVFGAKAAPGYFMAKLIIKLINAVGEVVNNDTDIDGKLKVVFMENYRVSLAETIIPAADLSEQISLAGTEASGTGNMKFALNGALTIGTLDGANVEIREAVGEDNIFIFGMTVEEVERLRADGYRPQDHIDRSPGLKRALELVRSGFFSRHQPDAFKPILENFIYDTYMVAADFNAYRDCQRVVASEFENKPLWARKAILNVARMGRFSSDRSIRDYARKIWDIEVPPIGLAE